MNLVTYLINLDGSNDRLESARQQLNHANMSFIRVPAFDGRNLDSKSIPEYDENKALAHMGRTLKGGELGCYFSHLDCARRFLATEADYAVVLEDDLQITANALDIIKEVLTWLELQQSDWYLLHLAAERQKIMTPLHEVLGYKLVHAHYFPVRTTGLVWSRQGAQTFVEQHNRIYAPVDNYFRFWLTRNNKGLSLVPPLVVANGAESLIDGINLRKSTGRSRWHGFIKQKRLWGDKLIAYTHKYFNSK